jgi:hypothetical protein
MAMVGISPGVLVRKRGWVGFLQFLQSYSLYLSPYSALGMNATKKRAILAWGQGMKIIVQLEFAV